MMGWERPLMERHAELICRRAGARVVNVGFGLGIIDGLIQVRSALLGGLAILTGGHDRVMMCSWIGVIRVS